MLVGCASKEEVEKIDERVKVLQENVNNFQNSKNEFGVVILHSRPLTPPISQKLNSSISSASVLKRYKPDLRNNRSNFNVSRDLIKMSIPITDNKLRVMDAKNISSEKQNAILVILDGNGGFPTSMEDVTGVLEVEYKLSDLFSNTRRLDEHKKLRVVVFHDDDVTMDKINFFKNCIERNNGNYNDVKCTRSIEIKKIFAPDEEDGSILQGG